MLTIGAAEIEAFLATFFYPFVRIAALMTSAPLLSHRSIPRPTRIALALLVTVVVAPTLPPTAYVAPFSAAGVLLIMQQALIGLAVGFVMQIFFAAAELAGEAIGLQMGLSFATFVDAQNSDPSPIIGSYLSVTLMLVFLALNGHLMLIDGLVDTFASFPLDGRGVQPSLDLRAIVLTGRELFLLGVTLALPVIAAMLLANLALGVLTRTAPQLNLFAVGFPVTLGTGLAMLALAMPFVVPAMESALLRGLALLAR
jgi:flagellar biosynthetic protein FliR